jgi:hypothetical protein
MGILSYNSLWEAREIPDAEDLNCQTRLVYFDPVAFDGPGECVGVDCAWSLMPLGIRLFSFQKPHYPGRRLIP